MSKKKKSKIKKNNQTELAVTGPGVEALVIKAIETAADAYADARKELDALQETADDAEKELLKAVRDHRDELIKDDKGGVSYRYGDILITLKPTSEKLSVKTLHDATASTED